MKLAWQQIPSPVITEIISSNCDGIVLDTEHGYFNNETLFSCIQVATSLKKKCFVRLTEPEKTKTRACLDAGADGLIFSTVETIEQCQKINDICKFPSQGGQRGLGLVRQNAWGEKSLITKKPIIIAQIETVKAVNNISAIKSYNFDFYMIGPYDLSASLGIAGDFDNQLYLQTVKKIFDQISRDKMAVHVPKDVKNQLKKYENYGIIAIGMDTIALIEKYKEYNNA